MCDGVRHLIKGRQSQSRGRGAATAAGSGEGVTGQVVAGIILGPRSPTVDCRLLRCLYAFRPCEQSTGWNARDRDEGPVVGAAAEGRRLAVKSL